MIQLQGEQEIRQIRELVWKKLTDPSSMGKCIPGLEEIEYVDDRSLKGKVKLAVSFIKGTMLMHIRIHDLMPTSSLEMSAQSEGIGSRVDLEVRVELSEKNQVTSLKWKAEARMTGLLGRVSEGLLIKAANQLVNDTFQRFKKQIEEPSSGQL